MSSQLETLYGRLDNAGRSAFQQQVAGYVGSLTDVEPCTSATIWADARKLVQDVLLKECSRAPLVRMMAPSVGPEWHDQFLRAATRPLDRPCTMRERCEGPGIPDFQKVLVAYEEPDGTASNPPICLLCTRRCWFQLACAEIARIPEFLLDVSSFAPEEESAAAELPEGGCLNSHAVLVGCLGGYSASFVVRTPAGGHSIRGFSGHLLRYSKSHYQVDTEDEDRLTQRALLFQ